MWKVLKRNFRRLSEMIVFFYGKELMKLILAITRDNEKLIYEVCKENGFENPQVLTGVDSLKKFAVQELRNLNNYKQIIIDIASTKETENEIVQAVVAIKSMYNIKNNNSCFRFSRR